MKNFESSAIGDLKNKSQKMEKLNRLVENSEHLGLDGVEKEKLINKVDKLNKELEFLEEVSGLSNEEIEFIYTNIAKEQAILETKKFFDILTTQQQWTLFQKDVQSFVKIAKEYLTPSQLVIVAIGFLLITSNTFGMKDIHLEDVGKNVGVVNAQTKKMVSNIKDKKQDIIEQEEMSLEQKKQINEIIIPEILDKFKGFVYAEIAIMSQKNIDYSKIEGDPRLIMLFFDEPIEREMLDDYLIRQAKRGVLNENDVDILYKYFSHTEYNIN